LLFIKNHVCQKIVKQSCPTSFQGKKRSCFSLWFIIFFYYDFKILIPFYFGCFFQHKLQQQGSLQTSELDRRIVIHHGIPSSSSLLAFDHIMILLVIGTLLVHSLSPA
jgi:phosphate starvation-inducible membrane PsiE